jgi:multiple sugar transport system permease protein
LLIDHSVGAQNSPACNSSGTSASGVRARNPAITPGIFTIGIFTFLSSWGDLLFGLTIITDDTMRPVAAGLRKFIGSNVSQWNMVMALAAMEMLPPFLLFLLTQRYVVAGLTAGAGK